MITKEISYEDLDGNILTETFQFHLKKSAMLKLKLRYAGDDDLEAYFKKLIEEQDGDKMIAVIEDFIRSSVGKRSEDGKSFDQSPEIVNSFMNSEALSELLLELLSGEGMTPQEFFGGLSPSFGAAAKAEIVSSIETTKDPTEMSREELLAAFRNKSGAKS